MLKAGLLCASIVTFFASAAAAQAATCYDPWSMGGSTPTIGPVCGEIKAQGGGAGGIATPYGTPGPQSGGNVQLLGGAAGPGVGGLVAVSGSYGAGHIRTSAHVENTPGNSGSMLARGDFGFLDKFHVVGADPLQALFTSSLEGIMTSVGEGHSVFRIQDLTTASFVIFSLEADVYSWKPSETKTVSAWFAPGHEYMMSYSMRAEAFARIDFLANRPDVEADLGNTGKLFIDVLTGGGAFAFDSGHNYATNAVIAATTPIPAALPLFAAALGGLGLVGWRRRCTHQAFGDARILLTGNAEAVF